MWSCEKHKWVRDYPCAGVRRVSPWDETSLIPVHHTHRHCVSAHFADIIVFVPQFVMSDTKPKRDAVQSVISSIVSLFCTTVSQAHPQFPLLRITQELLNKVQIIIFLYHIVTLAGNWKVFFSHPPSISLPQPFFLLLSSPFTRRVFRTPPPCWKEGGGGTTTSKFASNDGLYVQ